MNKQLVIPFTIGYEKRQETYTFIVDYPESKFKNISDLINYIYSLENNIIDEDKNFKIKDVCDYNKSFEEMCETLQLLGYGIESGTCIIDNKERFKIWLYLINMVNNDPFTYFEEIDYHDAPIRSMGNI